MKKLFAIVLLFVIAILSASPALAQESTPTPTPTPLVSGPITTGDMAIVLAISGLCMIVLVIALAAGLWIFISPKRGA